MYNSFDSPLSAWGGGGWGGDDDDDYDEGGRMTLEAALLLRAWDWGLAWLVFMVSF